MIATTIHQRIKQRREDLGMSMTELTVLTGLGAWQTVQQWENGATAPSRANLPAVAKALNVTTQWLMAGNDEVADPRHLELLRALLEDHQMQNPHHEDRCPLCKEAKAVLEAA